jgi:hypothetical protein
MFMVWHPSPALIGLTTSIIPTILIFL